MGFLDGFGKNWFTFLQSAGIIASLFFTGLALRSETRARRITSLFTITQHHREIWTQLYKERELVRVLSPDVDLSRSPVTDEEELFVTLLILHLNTSYRAMREQVFLTPQRLQLD